MTQHDPRRARPAWGATSTCTRCGQSIIWQGRWQDTERRHRCVAKGTWGHHHSASRGTPQPWPPRLVAKAEGK